MHVMDKLLVYVHKIHAKHNLQKCPLRDCHVSVKSQDWAQASFSFRPTPQFEHVFTQGLGN